MPYINRDEARIFYLLLKEEGKYNYSESVGKYLTKEQQRKIFDALQNLEKNMESVSKDNRRHGRTSNDSFSDLIKRYACITISKSKRCK